MTGARATFRPFVEGGRVREKRPHIHVALRICGGFAQGAEGQREIRMVLRHPRQKIGAEFEIAFHLKRKPEFLPEALMRWL